MNICIVTHFVRPGDGQGRVNYELTHYLLRQGVKVTLIADEVAPDLVEAGAQWMAIHPGFHNLRLARVLRFQYLADRLIADVEDQFDLVMGCGRTLNRPHAVNAVHFVHSTWLESPFHPSCNSVSVNGAYQWLFSQANAQWELETLRKAGHVIAVSDKIQRELEGLGLPSSRIETILNGVDTDEFAPGAVDRHALGLPPDVPLGFFAGDIQSNRKNLDTVLSALAQVPNMHLAIAGRVEGSPYPDLANQLGVAERVHFLGFRSDVADLMRASDVFVFPSRYEACTLALLEALASSLPVVTATTTGGAELVGENSGVVLDDPEDLPGLVDALHRILSDEYLQTTMQRSAREVAKAHTWKQMGARYLNSFERILHRPPLPA
jgi:glycosyltransferase involved in cell wall biosynthesis